MNHHTAASVREWTDVLARVRFGTIEVAGKKITGARIKLIAGRCATYADGDGSRVRPGIARLAVDCETDYRTAKSAVAVLRRLGLLLLVKAAVRRGHADEYQLAIPEDLLDRDDIEVWSPAKLTIEIERVREANRGKPRGGRKAPQTTEAQGPPAPAHAPEPDDPAGACGTANPTPAGATGTNPQGPPAPATHHSPRHHNDQPTDEDPRTAVTGPRAPAVPPPADPPLARSPLARCQHGMQAGTRRTDGKLACPICRVLAARHAAGSQIQPEGLAPVIPIRSSA